MQHEQGKTGTHYQQSAQDLAEAVEKQQAASRDARHSQEVLDTTQDKNLRRYFEGLVKLSTLEALHHNLIAKSCQRDGHTEDSKRDLERKTNSGALVMSPQEITLLEKGRNIARAKYDAHYTKALAFSLLVERYRDLGKEDTARDYHDRARPDRAAARVYVKVIKGYDEKLEDLGKANQVSPDFRRSFRTLEQSARYLDDYNSGYARVRNHIRRLLACETAIQKLEAACDKSPEIASNYKLLREAIDRRERIKQMAETEALDAARSYKNFQNEIESAERGYDALGRTLTSNPLELANGRDASETFREADHPVVETSNANNPNKEPELDKPGIEGSGSDVEHPPASGNRQSRVIVAAVISKALKELDRGI